jgi:predicted 3-demethylubiquinone-9 3-methyltransferase (glyoxalase superfamily)
MHITPSLWFSADGGSLEKIVEYYKTIFGNDFIAGHITSLGETPSGHTEISEVTIFDQPYSFMCTQQEHDQFNDALSLTIYCADQDEIDRVWDYFTREGAEVQCGWCIDKYGLRWQVLPKNFAELTSQPHAWEVMMKQKKIVIEEYVQPAK